MPRKPPMEARGEADDAEMARAPVDRDLDGTAGQHRFGEREVGGKAGARDRRRVGPAAHRPLDRPTRRARAHLDGQDDRGRLNDAAGGVAGRIAIAAAA